MQTYVNRDAWGNTEVRSIGEPITYKGHSPDSLVGRLVMVRPFYRVPNGRSGLKSVRSPFVFEAHVIEVSGDMVKVRYTWATDGPWPPVELFHPGELHQTRTCECPACKGDGLSEHTGA